MEKELFIFENKFETVNYKFYGAMHKTWQKPVPGFIRLS